MPQPTARARPTGHPGYSQTLPCEPGSAATARRLVRAALTAWGLDDLAEDGALIVSELVTNAVQHARRESLRVVIDRPGTARVRIGVMDFSKARPVLREPDPEREDGRGLALVSALAESWGSEPLPAGKRVWAQLQGKGRGWRAGRDGVRGWVTWSMTRTPVGPGSSRTCAAVPRGCCGRSTGGTGGPRNGRTAFGWSRPVKRG